MAADDLALFLEGSSSWWGDRSREADSVDTRVPSFPLTSKLRNGYVSRLFLL